VLFRSGSKRIWNPLNLDASGESVLRVELEAQAQFIAHHAPAAVSELRLQEPPRR